MSKIHSEISDPNFRPTHIILVRMMGLASNKMYISKKDNRIHVKLGDFGQADFSFSKQQEKLSYLVTMLVCIKGLFWGEDASESEIRETLDKLMETEDFKRLSREVAVYTKCGGIYVENSVGRIAPENYVRYANLRAFLDEHDIPSFERFIFDPGIVLNTGDNTVTSESWRNYINRR